MDGSGKYNSINAYRGKLASQAYAAGALSPAKQRSGKQQQGARMTAAERAEVPF